MQLQKDKQVPSKWKLQITEHYLQLHSICNTNIQTTSPFVHLGIAEGYWKQIIDSLSKTRSIRMTLHDQVISGIQDRTVTKSQN